MRRSDEMSDSHDDRPAWHDDQAAELIGLTVLIGVTRVGPEGDLQEQMFGVVRSADSVKGFEVELMGSRLGEAYWLPPDLSNFFAAPPGEYRLRSTGEVVSDPDFTCSWTLYPPAH